ncbi:helix-turn-helix domain-containing protein [Senegalimassilia anaerobia]|uniref:helix-turn-helix domain-containing protein n=1 Tax=Senegalimassilia anaerobia TaxID=1473216 RepID=UPI0023F0E1B1|nr:helix-turn-helix domain-containing protein [Senegalimassilia anaerobia]
MGNLIHRGKGSWTHVENTIFYETRISAKAKGVYCQIRSLESNPEWTFTIAGFATLFKDGIDSIKSSLKELESFGFLLRARMRGSNGRFVGAEEALWVTLDDPSMYEEEAEQLRSEGYSIVSKRDASKAKVKGEQPNDSKSSQFETTCGKSTCGESTSGHPTSGKATCGQSSAINPLGDQGLTGSKDPSLIPSHEEPKPKRAQASKRMDGFPEEFEELCALSIKPIVALRFKEDCYEAWKVRCEEGYTPQQIIRAYEVYARGYRNRNGSDASMAKNLASWLKREGGLVDIADDPERCIATNDDGSPLSMEDLADRFKRFGRMWRKAKARRGLVLSNLQAIDPSFTPDDAKATLKEDREYNDHMDACKLAYDEYLRWVDPTNAYGLMRVDSPFEGVSLIELMARKEEINALANDDPEFAELLDEYETLSRDITACRLIGQMDDKTWEKRRYEELELQHRIEERVREHREAHDA